MGESESLYGGLDRSTVYTAQSVFQLQELLRWKQYVEMSFKSFREKFWQKEDGMSKINIINV